MKIKKGRITLLFDYDGMSIELYDQDASVRFVKVTLNKEQTCQALSRLGHTHCEIEVRGLDKVGKVIEQKDFVFQMPKDVGYGKKQKEVAIREADRLCPEGWEASHYFGSQGSFFDKDGEPWARTRIMRWAEEGEA